MRIHRMVILACLIGLTACSDGGDPDTQDGVSAASRAYTAFFEELHDGDRDEALEELAPEGALGDTFRAGSYFMMADVMEQHFGQRDGLESVVIDEAEEVSKDEVRIEGRIRFGDGTEEERRIIFVREGSRWVGRL